MFFLHELKKNKKQYTWPVKKKNIFNYISYVKAQYYSEILRVLTFLNMEKKNRTLTILCVNSFHAKKIALTPTKAAGHLSKE